MKPQRADNDETFEAQVVDDGSAKVMDIWSKLPKAIVHTCTEHDMTGCHACGVERFH